VDMANSGLTWKAENGFKSGYLLELERMMLEKIPGCKLRVQPHIENRYRLLKKQYGVIADMLGQGLVGMIDTNVWYVILTFFKAGLRYVVKFKFCS
jgi:hypothetical protein